MRTFVQEHDWRLIVTALGLAVVAFLPAPIEDNSTLDICKDQVAQGGAAGTSQVRAGNVVRCYEEARQDNVSPLISPSEFEDIQ